MAFTELKNDILDANTNIRSYVKNSDEYIRLKIFKVLMRSITSFAQILLVGSILLISLLFLSIAASILIGEAINNVLYGFLIVGLFYMFIGIICYFMRAKLNKPLIRRFSQYYFDEL